MQMDHHGVIRPTLDPSHCNGCGLCASVCPPAIWSQLGVPRNGELLPESNLRAFSAYSTDNEIRIKASSGGFVTALVCHLLRSGKITGAILTRRMADDPLLSEPVLARNEAEVLACRGSKYSPVSFERAFSLLRGCDSAERIAVVGLPCHIQAISAACRLSPRLIRLITLKIALVCGGTPSLLAYEFLLKRFQIARGTVRSMQNRGDGWPGFMVIEATSGVVRFPYDHHLGMRTVLSSPLFASSGCLLCADPTGYEADLSVSDAWLRRFRSDRKGVNLVLVQSEIGGRAFDSAVAEDAIRATPCPVSDFIAANEQVIRRKRVYRFAAAEFADTDYARRLGVASRTSLAWSESIRVRIYFRLVLALVRLSPKTKQRLSALPVLMALKLLSLLRGR